VVDEVFDTQEIVVKPTGRLVRDLSVYSGTTILGDGRVIMILDAAGVAQRARAMTDGDLKGDASALSKSEVKQTEKVPLLLFKSGPDAPKAVPLSWVSRLEEVPAERIEKADGRLVVQYRDQLLPIVTPHSTPAELKEGSSCAVIVLSGSSGRSVGLWVEEILDIVESEPMRDPGNHKRGVLGLAVVNGRVTEVIDAQHYAGSTGNAEESLHLLTGAA
jgi:two-component system chemotaxis sensor kinase CheA